MLYRDRRPLLVFLAPALLLMVVMLYYPFFMSIVSSLYDIKGMAGTRQRFLGLENYAYMLKDPLMIVAFANSLKMMALTIVFQVGIALLLALMVDAIRKGQQFFRVVFFFPIVISATAIGLMFTLFYVRDGGMLNQILGFLGIAPVFWLDKGSAFIMVAIPVLWQYVGFYFVIILTGLAAIPEEVFESAALDGATGLKKTVYITLPLIRDVLVTCATLSITGSIKVFDLPAVIVNNGKPNGLTYFLGTYMHNQTFVAGNVDYGAGIAVVIVLLGVVISRLFSRALLRVGGEDA